MDLIKGAVLIVAIFFASNLLGLTTLNWILEHFATVFLIVLVIIFQPELRRFLERVGSSSALLAISPVGEKNKPFTFIQHILRSIDQLSKEKIGAIIVIERYVSLDTYKKSGVILNGELSAETLASLFWPGSPTHDGAVIIKKSMIESASCFLPLSKAPIPDRRLGTRHRAALGITELSDCLAIVISEETGVISLAEKGTLTRYLTKEALHSHLATLYKNASSSSLSSSLSFFT